MAPLDEQIRNKRELGRAARPLLLSGARRGEWRPWNANCIGTMRRLTLPAAHAPPIFRWLRRLAASAVDGAAPPASSCSDAPPGGRSTGRSSPRCVAPPSLAPRSVGLSSGFFGNKMFVGGLDDDEWEKLPTPPPLWQPSMGSPPAVAVLPDPYGRLMCADA